MASSPSLTPRVVSFRDKDGEDLLSALPPVQQGVNKHSDTRRIEPVPLDLPDIAWFEIQPDLAPTTSPEGELLDWNAFLTRFSAQDKPKTDNLSADQLNVLHEHKDKFLDIFQLLDTDGSGTISEEEFVSGIAMLNNQMPGESLKIENPAELYRTFDNDGNGEIDIQEFCQALQDSATLKNVTASLDSKQVESLQQNNEMLLLAFKYLDTDHRGAIDRDEFKRGIDLLNKRLPERSKLGDPMELFDLLDEDGNGEIGRCWRRHRKMFVVLF